MKDYVIRNGIGLPIASLKVKPKNKKKKQHKMKHKKQQKPLHQIIKEVEAELKEVREKEFLDIYDKVFCLVDMRMYAHKIINKLQTGG